MFRNWIIHTNSTKNGYYTFGLSTYIMYYNVRLIVFMKFGGILHYLLFYIICFHWPIRTFVLAYWIHFTNRFAKFHKKCTNAQSVNTFRTKRMLQFDEVSRVDWETIHFVNWPCCLWSESENEWGVSMRLVYVWIQTCAMYFKVLV